MQGPKRQGHYPDREIDCQEAVAEGIANLVDDAMVTGSASSEADVLVGFAKISTAPSAGMRTLLQEAVDAGWTINEAAEAIAITAAGMRTGYLGTDPDE